MNQPPPSLLQTGFAHVRERFDVNRLIAQVLGAFGRAAPVAFSGPDVVAARLDTLRGPLQAHFEEIERGSLLDRIERSTPERASLCARLRREHPKLLRRLDSLRAAAPIERRAPAWAREVRAFVEELTRHEAREADLLQAADGAQAD